VICELADTPLEDDVAEQWMRQYGLLRTRRGKANFLYPVICQTREQSSPSCDMKGRHRPVTETVVNQPLGRIVVCDDDCAPREVEVGLGWRLHRAGYRQPERVRHRMRSISRPALLGAGNCIPCADARGLTDCGHVKNPSDLSLSYCYYISYNSDARRDEQDGYVPNVVYSCGALVHAETLVLPYGIGDAAIGIATVPLLLDALALLVHAPLHCRSTLLAYDVDIASNGAFTGGVARKPPSAAAIRIRRRNQCVSVLSGKSGSDNCATAMRAAQPFDQRTTT
jgi:glycosyl hydrolase family 130 (putative beta-1,4-mannooligosaccharide phosphorylase)